MQAEHASLPLPLSQRSQSRFLDVVHKPARESLPFVTFPLTLGIVSTKIPLWKAAIPLLRPCPPPPSPSPVSSRGATAPAEPWVPKTWGQQGSPWLPLTPLSSPGTRTTYPAAEKSGSSFGPKLIFPRCIAEMQGLFFN